MKQIRQVLIIFASIFLVYLPVHAQRGAGEDLGIAARAEKPAIQKLSGKLEEIVREPCMKSTGCALEGVHLRLRTKAQEALNLHLGPQSALDPLIESLSVGDTVNFQGFRTSKLGKGEMIAKSLSFRDKDLTLRDDSYRPFWAGKGKPVRNQGM